MPPLAIKQYEASNLEDIKTIPRNGSPLFYFQQVIHMTEETIDDFWGEPVFTYTLDNAVEDGQGLFFFSAARLLKKERDNNR